MDNKDKKQYSADNFSISNAVLLFSNNSIKKFSTIFLCLGSIQIILKVIKMILDYFFIKNKFMDFSSIIHFSKYITLSIFLVIFYKIKKDMIKKYNVNTVQFFELWGIIILIIPTIKIGVMIIQTILYGGYTDNNMMSTAYFIITEILEYISVMWGVYFTGHILRRKNLKLFSLILLFVCPLMFAIGMPKEINNTILYVISYTSDKVVWLQMISYLTYIYLGFYLKIQFKDYKK